MLEAMGIYQTERHRVHSVIKEHGLAGLYLSEIDFLASNRFTPPVYRGLSSVADFGMLEGLMAGVKKEAEIRNKIKKLQCQKEYGVKSKIDQFMFVKLDVGRRIDMVKSYSYTNLSGDSGTNMSENSIKKISEQINENISEKTES